MKKGILPNTAHRDDYNENKPANGNAMSEELQQAIQNLIYRMRERGPVQGC